VIDFKEGIIKPDVKYNGALSRFSEQQKPQRAGLFRLVNPSLIGGNLFKESTQT